MVRDVERPFAVGLDAIQEDDQILVEQRDGSREADAVVDISEPNARSLPVAVCCDSPSTMSVLCARVVRYQLLWIGWPYRAVPGSMAI